MKKKFQPYSSQLTWRKLENGENCQKDMFVNLQEISYGFNWIFFFVLLQSSVKVSDLLGSVPRVATLFMKWLKDCYSLVPFYFLNMKYISDWASSSGCPPNHQSFESINNEEKGKPKRRTFYNWWENYLHTSNVCFPPSSQIIHWDFSWETSFKLTGWLYDLPPTKIIDMRLRYTEKQPEENSIMSRFYISFKFPLWKWNNFLCSEDQRN